MQLCTVVHILFRKDIEQVHVVAFIVHAYYRNYAYFNEMLNKLVPAAGITVNSRHVFIIEKNYLGANKFNVYFTTTLLSALEVKDCFADNSHSEYY